MKQLPTSRPLRQLRSPKSKSPERPEILIAEATKRVLTLLREEDEVIGGLTDRHVKWLMMFTYIQFNVRHAHLAFDFHSTPKKIIITPLRSGNPFPVKDWARAKFKVKWQRIERDLSGYIGLDKFKITFSRLAPNVAYRLEGNRDVGD